MFLSIVDDLATSRTVNPEVPPHLDRSNSHVPQPGDFDNLKEHATRIPIDSVQVILSVLFGMHKTVLCTKDPLGFLTTNAPSTWYDQKVYRRHPYERAVGLAHPEVEITLPISPAQCRLFTHRPVGPLYFDGVLPLKLDNYKKTDDEHQLVVDESPAPDIGRSNSGCRSCWPDTGLPPTGILTHTQRLGKAGPAIRVSPAMRLVSPKFIPDNLSASKRPKGRPDFCSFVTPWRLRGYGEWRHNIRACIAFDPFDRKSHHRHLLANLSRSRNLEKLRVLMHQSRRTSSLQVGILLSRCYRC